jgi:hypothetical protein
VNPSLPRPSWVTRDKAFLDVSTQDTAGFLTLCLAPVVAPRSSSFHVDSYGRCITSFPLRRV